MGNSLAWENCLRYSRADYLRKLIRSQKNNQTKQTKVETFCSHSPFRRWTCGRIINTFIQRLTNQREPVFNVAPGGKEWVDSPTAVLKGMACFVQAVSFSLDPTAWQKCHATLYPFLPKVINSAQGVSFHWLLLQVQLFLLTYFTPSFC